MLYHDYQQHLWNLNHTLLISFEINDAISDNPVMPIFNSSDKSNRRINGFLAKMAEVSHQDYWFSVHKELISSLYNWLNILTAITLSITLSSNL